MNTPNILQKKKKGNPRYQKQPHNFSRAGGQVSRLVVESCGRKLRRNEVVHHVDGNRENNDPNNLAIFKNQAEHMRVHVFLRRREKAEFLERMRSNFWGGPPKEGRDESI